MLVNRAVRMSDGTVLSMRMEQKFWKAFLEICRREGCRPGALVKLVEDSRANGQDNICRTAAVRVFILNYFLEASTEEGHKGAGHGDVQAPAPRESMAA